jgi:DNA-binding PadR family transcriptional regulator
MRTSPVRTQTLTATEAAVLGILAGGEGSGYDLRKRIERSVGYFWAPAKTQIYAVLPRLVEAGLATRRDIEQRTRPSKQVYRITTAGRRALKRWVDTGPVDPAPDKSPMLLKLFFGSEGDPDALLEQLRERRAAAEQLLADLDELDRAAEQSRSSDEDFFPSLTRAWGRAYASAYVAWANETERALAAKRH